MSGLNNVLLLNCILEWSPNLEKMDYSLIIGVKTLVMLVQSVLLRQKSLRKKDKGDSWGEAGQSVERSETDETVWTCCEDIARQCGGGHSRSRQANGTVSVQSVTAGPNKATVSHVLWKSEGDQSVIFWATYIDICDVTLPTPILVDKS